MANTDASARRRAFGSLLRRGAAAFCAAFFLLSVLVLCVCHHAESCGHDDAAHHHAPCHEESSRQCDAPLHDGATAEHAVFAPDVATPQAKPAPTVGGFFIFHDRHYHHSVAQHPPDICVRQMPRVLAPACLTRLLC